MIEKVKKELNDIFVNYSLSYENSKLGLLIDDDYSLSFKNYYSQRASAFYYSSYNLIKIVNEFNSNQNYLDLCKQKLNDLFYERENIWSSEYVSINMGISYEDYYTFDIEMEIKFYNEKYSKIEGILENLKTRATKFLRRMKANFAKISNKNDDSRYNILSFPWVSCGSALLNIKCLNSIKREMTEMINEVEVNEVEVNEVKFNEVKVN